MSKAARKSQYHLITLILTMVIAALMMGSNFVKTTSAGNYISFGWPVANLIVWNGKYEWQMSGMIFNGVAFALSFPISIIFFETMIRRHEDRNRALSLMSFLILFPLSYIPPLLFLWAFRDKYGRGGRIDYFGLGLFVASLFVFSLISIMSIYWGIKCRRTGGSSCKWIIAAGLIGIPTLFVAILITIYWF